MAVSVRDRHDGLIAVGRCRLAGHRVLIREPRGTVRRSAGTSSTDMPAGRAAMEGTGPDGVDLESTMALSDDCVLVKDRPTQTRGA